MDATRRRFVGSITMAAAFGSLIATARSQEVFEVAHSDEEWLTLLGGNRFEVLRRSATERWARSKAQWSQYDGLMRVTDATRAFLQTQRLGARPYSVSALQNYSYCPYRFLLSAMYRL